MPDFKKTDYFFAAAYLIIVCFLVYGVERNESVVLLAGYSLVFIVYAWVSQTARLEAIQFWIFVAVGARVILLIATPQLSDDFYRFIWDGRLLANGIHPFAELPNHYLTNSVPGLDQWLFDQLNSQDYFTIYPPLAQYIFLVAVLISPNSVLGSVIVMRLFILAAEFGTIALLWKLLPQFNVSRKNISWYVLNPLVVLELTGNLHFEALVIFFMLLALHFLLKTKIVQAGIFFALAVAAKLMPLIFLPHFFNRLGFRRSVLFYSCVGVMCILVSIPLLDREIVEGFQSSLELYFRRFEFNASIYYLVREYGYWMKGYNIIQSVGWKLALLSTLGILIVSFWPFEWKNGRLQQKVGEYPFSLQDTPMIMMWVLLIYFLFTTTLHPWYITTLLALSVFSGYRFVVIWTGVIFFTYVGYSSGGFQESLLVVLLEYLLVIGYLVYELLWKRNALDSY